MIGKLICLLTKHKRGKRLETVTYDGSVIYECPRCKATWVRKPKPQTKLRVVA